MSKALAKTDTPAFDMLTDNQQRFVIEHLVSGGRDATVSYRRAYPNCTSDNAAAVEAHRMLRNPKILAAMREEADRRLRGGAILGASALVEIASDPLHKDRLKAASELLTRSGLIVENVSRMIVEDRRENAEIIKSIENLARNLGVDPAKLLGRSGAAEAQTIDADFEMVEDELDSTGLEDML